MVISTENLDSGSRKRADNKIIKTIAHGNFREEQKNFNITEETTYQEDRGNRQIFIKEDHNFKRT